MECEVRWLGDRHPEFNHTTWMGEEIAKARALVTDVPEGQVDWYEIAKKLGVYVHIIVPVSPLTVIADESNASGLHAPYDSPCHPKLDSR